MARTQGLSANLNAFLDTIAVSELGAQILAESDDGYNVIVGSTPGHLLTFDSYVEHPGIPEHIGTLGLTSTAAGRYQILKRYADAYIAQLHLPDFSPESQDMIALQMIDECKARADIEAGYTADALVKCSSRWASLPASHAGQHVNRMTDLLTAFTGAGGTISSA